MTGGRVAHPLLISLANLLMDFRTKATNHPFYLLALLPIPKFVHKDRKFRSILENRLTHECLDFILKPLKKAAEVGIMMSDPLGSLRYVYTPLAAYIVDTPEAAALSGVAGKTSHMTMAMYKQFGDPFKHPSRTGSKIIETLSTIENTSHPWNLKAYVQEAKAHRLNGVHRPFWRDWPLSDPSQFFTPEPLHHWHKMFWDHDAKWCIHAVGQAEIDFRFSVLHSLTGFRHFTEGISHLKQVTGRDHRDMQRYIVAVVAGAIPNKILIAIRSLADFRYLTQAPEISDEICNLLDDALYEFHLHKDAIISAGARTGKGGRVIDNWHIPKLELLQSVTSSIRGSGAPIQWSADHTERCHITEVKNPSRSGNNKGYEAQICRHLDRAEKCRLFDLATTVHDQRVHSRALTLKDYLNNDDDNDDNDDDNDTLDVLLEVAEAQDNIPPFATGPEECLPQPVLPLKAQSVAALRHANYFELAKALEDGLFPRVPLPHRTVIGGATALHLTRDPSQALSIDDVITKYNIQDLQCALANFLIRMENNSPFVLGGRRVAALDVELPFDKLQLWGKLRLQTHSYHTPHNILLPQTVNASPPSNSWPFGRSDIVLINADPSQVWPKSGLKGVALIVLLQQS